MGGGDGGLRGGDEGRVGRERVIVVRSQLFDVGAGYFI